MFELTWLQSWQIQVHTKLIFLWNIKQTDQFHLFSLEIAVLLVMAIFLKGFALINNANLECKMFVMRNENLLIHSTSWRKEHVCFWSFVSEPVSISLCPYIWISAIWHPNVQPVGCFDSWEFQQLISSDLLPPEMRMFR